VAVTEPGMGDRGEATLDRPQTQDGSVTGTRVSAATAAVIRTGVVVSAVSAAVVLVGGSVAWLLERHAPGSTFDSWGDSLWWALTTLTTVGYGDHVPVTTAGRLVGAAVMIAGVAVLGGVAAVVALIVARAVALAEEQALEAEAESLERRLESRLDAVDARLARIEEQLHAFEHLRGGKGCRHDRPDDTPCGRC
jgi:voltage-gated potassium channel Kch